MDESVDIDWYMGCYSGSWKVCMIGRGTTRKVWNESVPFTAILRSIQFTKSMKLHKDTVLALKNKYPGLF